MAPERFPDSASAATWGSLREGRREDLPSLLGLQAELSRPSPALLVTALSGAGTVLVSVDDGRPVGYLLAIPGQETAHVAELVVAPGYRREGRASGLLALALRSLGAARVTLAVEPDNRAARRCYEHAGFEVAARRPDYYDGDPALILERPGAIGADAGRAPGPAGAERPDPD